METTNTNNANGQTSEGKTIAVIAYLTVIGLIVAMVMNSEKKNSIAHYHIRQSLGLALTGLGIGIIGMVPILGWIISFFGFLVLLYMWIMGLMNAINDHQRPVPLMGEKYLTWFANF